MFLKIFPPAFHVYIFTYSCILMMLMHIKVRCVVCFHLFYFSFRYFIVSLVTSLHFVYFKKKKKKGIIYSYSSFCFISFIWSKPWLMVAGRLESQTILSVLGNYFLFFKYYYYYLYIYIKPKPLLAPQFSTSASFFFKKILIYFFL